MLQPCLEYSTTESSDLKEADLTRKEEETESEPTAGSNDITCDIGLAIQFCLVDESMDICVGNDIKMFLFVVLKVQLSVICMYMYLTFPHF